MDKIQRQLKSSFIFKGLPDSRVCLALEGVSVDVRSFERTEVIYSPESAAKEIGFVLSGICEVKRIHTDGTSLPLNTISHPGSFGIISVLTEGKEFPTYVVAKNKCEVAFITKDDLLSLMRFSPEIAINVAEFLAGRVAFLNEKVNTFSGTTCEEKLAREILNVAKTQGTLEFALNRKRTAELISCGRASLYRALDSLKTAGFIDYDNKKIYIKDLTGLERMKK